MTTDLPSLVRRFSYRANRFTYREVFTYVGAALLTLGATAVALRLWRMTINIPLTYGGDALYTLGNIDAVNETGWYEVQPRLGAPFGMVLHDFGAADNLHLAIIWAMSAFTHDAGTLLNLYFLLGFPLAAVTATWFFRTIGASRPLSAVLATLFAIAPYHFWRGEPHLYLASYWPVPLVATLVVWLLQGKSIWRMRQAGRLRAVSGHNIGVLLILVVGGSATQYYAAYNVLILALASLIAWNRLRQWRSLVGPAIAATIVGTTLILNMLPDTLYALANGRNYLSGVRSAIESEWLGLRISEFFIPLQTTRIPVLREIADTYWTASGAFGEPISLGVVAAAGLAVVFWQLIVGVRGRLFGPAVAPRTMLARGIAGIVFGLLLIGLANGLSMLIATFVSPQLRAWNRMSIYIALFALAALALALVPITRRLRRALQSRAPSPWGRAAASNAAIALVLLSIGLPDQVLADARVPDYSTATREYQEDRSYAQALESRLPDEAMVFQLPYVPFPEGPASVNQMHDYDHLRLALYTTTLRYSYAAVKGRPSADWAGVVEDEEPGSLVDRLAAIGFSGISINRKGYEDHGVALEGALQATLGADPALVSDDGTYSYWSLSGIAANLVNEFGEAYVEELAELTLHPVIAYAIPPNLTFRWSGEYGQTWDVTDNSAQIALDTNSEHPRSATISFRIEGLPPGTRVLVSSPDGSTYRYLTGEHVTFPVLVQAGRNILEVAATASATSGWRIADFTVTTDDCLRLPVGTTTQGSVAGETGPGC